MGPPAERPVGRPFQATQRAQPAGRPRTSSSRSSDFYLVCSPTRRLADLAFAAGHCAPGGPAVGAQSHQVSAGRANTSQFSISVSPRLAQIRDGRLGPGLRPSLSTRLGWTFGRTSGVCAGRKPNPKRRNRAPNQSRAPNRSAQTAPSKADSLDSPAAGQTANGQNQSRSHHNQIAIPISVAPNWRRRQPVEWSPSTGRPRANVCSRARGCRGHKPKAKAKASGRCLSNRNSAERDPRGAERQHSGGLVRLGPNLAGLAANLVHSSRAGGLFRARRDPELFVLLQRPLKN